MLTQTTLLMLLMLLVASKTHAFQSMSSFKTIQRVNRQQRTVTKYETEDLYQEGEEYGEGEEFFVSQEQILYLRKQANKRESSKRLPKLILSPEEREEVSEETVESIIHLFEDSEIIEVRGISRDKKKHVHDTAHGLAGLLEEEMEKPVVVVNIKGFAAKMYSPWNEDRGNNIQLRTSYKPGQWTRKAKPVRDKRGQIIMGEDGKSIKEIPE